MKEIKICLNIFGKMFGEKDKKGKDENCKQSNFFVKMESKPRDSDFLRIFVKLSNFVEKQFKKLK